MYKVLRDAAKKVGIRKVEERMSSLSKLSGISGRCSDFFGEGRRSRRQLDSFLPGGSRRNLPTVHAGGSARVVVRLGCDLTFQTSSMQHMSADW